MGAKQKIKAFAGHQVRILRLEDGFLEKTWCEKPHFGLVVAGQVK